MEAQDPDDKIEFFQSISIEINSPKDEPKFEQIKLSPPESGIDSVSLSNINVTSLDFLKIKNFKDIIILEITNCFLSTLENISELPELNFLNLSNNKISSLDQFSKKQFDKLETLVLANNIIESLSPIKDTIFPKLKKIDLSDNKISSIADLVANGSLKELEALYINQNFIKSIDDLENAKFKKIKELQITGKKI